MTQKKLMRIASFFSSSCFELCPLLLNGIEVRAVRRQELYRMPLRLDGLHDVGSLMEWRTIQHNHCVCRNRGKECTLYPRKKDRGINVAIPQFHGEQCKVEHCANGIQSSFGVPIMFSIASDTSGGISMRSRCIHRKATFIKIHDGALFDVFIPTNLRLKPYAGHKVSLGVKQSFFYS